MGRVKNLLKKFLPPSVNAFNKEIESLRKEYCKNAQEYYLSVVSEMHRCTEEQNTEMRQAITALRDELKANQEKQFASLGRLIQESVQSQTEQTVLSVRQSINDLEAQISSVSGDALTTLNQRCDAIDDRITVKSANMLEDLNRRCDEIDKRIGDSYSAMRDWKRRTTKLPILSFEVHLAEHCNLNCKGCDHFCSLAQPQFTDLNVFKRDFERLSELFNGEAREIHLLGGEPLLNPDVEKFCHIARECFPNAVINIVTNGILLPKMPDSFWRCCHDCNITVRPTKYPIKIDYESAQKKAEQFGVEYIYFNDAQQIKTMTHNQYDLKGLQDPRDSFLDCCRANKCIYLADGKLYPCTFAPNIHHFNSYFGTDLPVSERDSIDIFKAGSADEILEFLSNPIPFCRFCDIPGARVGQPWEVSKKQIDEWT